jgi:hypothetical protein
MTVKNETVQSLDDFVQTHGIMDRLFTDGDPMMESSKAWKKAVSGYKIHQKWTEPHSPWQNRAELDVREAKRGIRRFTKKSGSPRRLWCFLASWCANCEVSLLMILHYFRDAVQQNRYSVTSQTYHLGSNTLGMRQEVWYLDNDKNTKLGLWLGAATRHGGGDAFWILGKSCKPTVRSTVWSVTVEEKQTLEVQSLSEELHASVKSKIGDNRTDDDEVNQELEDILPEPDEDIYLEDDTEEEEKTENRRSEADKYILIPLLHSYHGSIG